MVCVFLVSHTVQAQYFPKKYDRQIKKAVKLYWADYPFWTNYKAQLYQESRLDTNATSPVSAMGLAQFMPYTWKDMSKRLGFKASAYDPKYAIEAGAYYMFTLRRSWKSKRPQSERQKLAQASYNAGLGNIIKAQKKCNMARMYEPIIKCLPYVTGHHSKETITYVKRIAKWDSLLHLGL